MMRISALLLALVLWLPASAAAPSVTEAHFGNGMKLLLLENHKLPTIQLALMFRGAGSAADPAGKTGLASVTAELLREGTKARSSKDLAQAVDFLGATLVANAEPDRSTIRAMALSRDSATLLDLLADVTLRPAFKPEEVERVKSRRQAALAQQLDDADGLASRALARFLLGKHPYGLPLEGLPKTVASITPADVTAFHLANYRADNAVLVVAGDFSPETLLPLIDAAFNTFKPGTAAPLPPAAEPVARATRILLLDKPDLTQAKIAFGHLGIPREHPDYYAALVMNGVLGGAGFLSRLTATVRSKLGLTYGIGSSFDARKVGGMFTITCSTKTESAVDAIKAATAELERLQQGGVTPRELADVQGYLTGSFALATETPEAQSNYLLYAETYNLGTDFMRTHPQKIRDVTAKDVGRAAQSLLNAGILRFVVVGNAEKLKDRLATLGPVEVRPHTAWADDGENP